MTRYGLRNRPAGYAHCPPGWSSPEAHPAFPNFGTIAYPEPLAPEVARSYELTRIVDAAEGARIARLGLERSGVWDERSSYLAECPEEWRWAVKRAMWDAEVWGDLDATVAALEGFR